MTEIIIIAVLYFACCGIFAGFVAGIKTCFKNMFYILLLPVWLLIIFIAALFMSEEEFDKASEKALNDMSKHYK